MWLLLALWGCQSTTSTTLYECSVDLLSLTPSSAQAGELVVLQARPLSTLADSALWMAGQQVPLSELSRSDCEDCDACKESAGCLSCGDDCDACYSDCLPCTETLSFTAPELAPGSYTVQLFNKYGVSETQLQLELGESADTGDSGTSDSGTSDSGTSDSGTSDSGD